MLLLLVALWVIDLRESKTTNCSTSTRTGKSTLQGAVLQYMCSITVLGQYFCQNRGMLKSLYITFQPDIDG